jgi:hypothetical protein
MRNPNRRTEKVLSRQIETLRAALTEKEIEYDLLDWYHETEPDVEDNPDRPSDESIERDMTEIREEREALEARLAAATRAWSAIAWRALDRLAGGR